MGKLLLVGTDGAARLAGQAPREAFGRGQSGEVVRRQHLSCWIFSAIVVLSAACTSKGKRDEDETAKPSEEPSDAERDDRPFWITFRLSTELPIETDLPLRVLPLYERHGLRPFCTSVSIAERLLLTAAHCARTPGSIYIGHSSGQLWPVAGVVPELGHRACSTSWAASDCTDAPPADAFEHIAHDLAVLRTSDYHFAPVTRVATLESAAALPQMYLLGYAGRPEPVLPRAVCDARRIPFDARTGTSQQTVALGDSGGPLVAIDEMGAPVVLGVASHREQASQDWYFALVRPQLPLRSEWTHVNVEIYLDRSRFRRLPECREDL